MAPRTGRRAEDHFRNWLARGQTGCHFASAFGGDLERASFYEPLTELDAGDVALFLDQCAIEKQVAVFLFPRLREAAEIAGIVRTLAAHHRWRAVIDPAMARDVLEVGIRMTWTTQQDLTTNAMGFGPLAYMPVTRRAPYFALAAWTAGHSNNVRSKKSETELTMGDAPPKMGATAYKTTLRKTRAATAALMDGEVSVDALRNLAFRFPKHIAEGVLGDLEILGEG